MVESEVYPLLCNYYLNRVGKGIEAPPPPLTIGGHQMSLENRSAAVQSVVYQISMGKVSPAMAVRENGLCKYEVAEACSSLRHNHIYDVEKGEWTTREIWIRKSR